MAETLTLSPAPISGQPDRVAVLLGEKPVGHAVSEEAARLMMRGWAARMDQRRRLAPRSMLGKDREHWLRGWDRANDQCRVVRSWE